MKLHEEFKLFEDMWEDDVAVEAPAGSGTIRCMHALYEDDDGYVSNVGVYAGDLSEAEMEDVLTEQGMSFVTCWDAYGYATSNTYNIGDVVEVFEVSDEDIEDVAAIAGKDPEEYKNVGVFESTDGKKLTEATAITTYLVEVDHGRNKTSTPNCTLDRAIKKTRSSLAHSLNYILLDYCNITWTDEATGKVVFEYISDTKVIKTKIPTVRAELQGVYEALNGTLYYDLIGKVVYDNFTEDERRYLKNDLEALKFKMKEIQMSREVEKFPL